MASNPAEIAEEDVEIALVGVGIPIDVARRTAEAAMAAVAGENGVATAGAEAGGGNGSGPTAERLRPVRMWALRLTRLWPVGVSMMSTCCQKPQRQLPSVSPWPWPVSGGGGGNPQGGTGGFDCWSPPPTPGRALHSVISY